MPDAAPQPVEPLRPLPAPTVRERVDAIVGRVQDLAPATRVVVAIVAAAVVAVIAYVVLLPSASAPATEATLPRASTTVPPAAETATTAPATLVVQAAGAVVHPGLFRLAPGARVDDLVTAAGGLSVDADPDRINLAAPLSDGEKVYVPRIGEAIPADVAGPGPETASGASPQPIDLNTATVAQLDTLPGVGPATAQAIIDYRAQHGRFRSVDDLLNVRGIGAAKLEQLRPLVRV